MNEHESRELQAALYLLKEYLDKDKHLASRGITLEEIYRRLGAMHEALDTVVREQIAQGLRQERHGKRIRELRDMVNAMSGQEDPPEDTGSFRIEDAKRAMELADLSKKVALREQEERDASTWWTRQRTLWIGIALMTLVSAVLSGCMNFGMWYLTHGQIGK